MKTSAQRQKQWRDRRKADGYQMITIWLEPDVARALDAAVNDSGTKQAERQRVINQSLRRCLI